MSKLFTALTFLLIASLSQAKTKEQILKKLNFNPGHYEVIVPTEKAQKEITDLEQYQKTQK